MAGHRELLQIRYRGAVDALRRPRCRDLLRHGKAGACTADRTGQAANGTPLLTLTRVACISPKGNCQAKASRQIITRSATLFANGERHEYHATRSDHWQFQSPCWVSVRRISTS